MRRLFPYAVALAIVAGPAMAQPYSDGDAPPAAPSASASRLYDALRLTPDEEGAWRAYQAAIAPDPQQAAASRQAQLLMPQLPTPRRLALLRAQMQADLAAFDRNAEAVRAFYAALTPDQQRIFDTETARRPDR